MTPTPCVAHPSTDFVHLDGPCKCFTGGPRPVHAARDRQGAAESAEGHTDTRKTVQAATGASNGLREGETP